MSRLWKARKTNMLSFRSTIDWHCDRASLTRSHVSARFWKCVMDREHTCCLCSKRIRKNGERYHRYKYEIDPSTGAHLLGRRPVLVKRKDPGLDWGCLTCYNDLGSPKVPYHFLPLNPCDSLFMLSYYRVFIVYFLVRVGGDSAFFIFVTLCR